MTTRRIAAALALGVLAAVAGCQTGLDAEGLTFACRSDQDCIDGFVCLARTPGGPRVCIPEDEDLAGMPDATDTADTSADTGADTSADTTEPSCCGQSCGCEEAQCLFDPACAETGCDNGLDDDALRNGLVDCQDPSCANDPVCGDCPQLDLGSRTGNVVATGTNLGDADRVDLSCALDDADTSLVWTAPQAGCFELAVESSGFRAALGVLTACDGAELACADPDEPGPLRLEPTAPGERFVLVIDSGLAGPGSSATGHWVLAVHEVDAERCRETACDDGLDDDDDGAIDCSDPDCVATCREHACADGLDDDGDGLVDCDDLDCYDACREPVCDDGRDDDGDGRIDCTDPDCDTAPFCIEPVCDDGLDDDGDGLVDCRDASCVTTPICYEDCFDGLDNNGDGRFDCLEPQCLAHAQCDALFCVTDPQGNPDCTHPACAAFAPGCGELDCADGLDDEGDGHVDCADPNCESVPACIELDCANGLDDDLNGLADCADPDCHGSELCNESNCAEGGDDDGDGLSDCADPDCYASDACAETSCTNGLDDDLNGHADCADPECYAEAHCLGLCPHADLGAVTGSPVLAADPAGAGDDSRGTCNLVPGLGGGGEDLAFAWTAPQTSCYRFDAVGRGSYTVYLLDGCGGAELGCSEDLGLEPAPVPATLDAQVEAGESYVVVVDGSFADPGAHQPFALHITDLAITCAELDCANGADEDGDTFIDCVDPDCADAPSCIPSDEVFCSNELDDDRDGLVDCLDPDCSGVEDCLGRETLEGCVEPWCFPSTTPEGHTQLYYQLDGPVHPLRDDFEAPCFLGTPGADMLITVPTTGFTSFTVTTCGAQPPGDAALAVFDGTPGGTLLACDEDAPGHLGFCAELGDGGNSGPPVPLPVPASGQLAVVVDEFEPGTWWDRTERRTVVIELIP